MDKQLKQISAELKVVNTDDMTIDHCVSDSLPDRVGDVINQDGWDFNNYFLNPVVLQNHDYDKPAIGKCLKLYRLNNQLRAVTQFAPTDEGKMYFALYKDDFQKAFSVGFTPIDYIPNKSSGYTYNKQELLEYSCVAVPCNPRATKHLQEVEKLEEEVKTEVQVDNVEPVEVIETIEPELSEKDILLNEVKSLHETLQAMELKSLAEEKQSLLNKIKSLKEKNIEKSGATLSSANATKLKGIHEKIKSIADEFSDFLSPFADPDSDGDNDETKSLKEEKLKNELSQEELDYVAKMVAEKINKALEVK